MLIETEEQLFYNKINLYDNVNTKKDILKHLDNIKVVIKNYNYQGKIYKFNNFADLINKKVRAYNHNKDTSIYVEEPKIKETKEFYTNKNLPIINKSDYQGFTIDKNNYKIMNYELKKEIHYAIHINPFIKYKNIYRPFYKDWFILQTNYKEYIDNILYVNETLDNKIDYDKEYIINNCENIIENYEPNNKLVNNFIPIKIYRYGINSIILYKNAITNEPIPSYIELKELKQNCNNYDSDEDEL
jgi:hypothetical protein